MGAGGHVGAAVGGLGIGPRYAPMRVLRAVRRASIRLLPAYARPTRCPVLREHMQAANVSVALRSLTAHVLGMPSYPPTTCYAMPAIDLRTCYAMPVIGLRACHAIPAIRLQACYALCGTNEPARLLGTERGVCNPRYGRAVPSTDEAYGGQRRTTRLPYCTPHSATRFGAYCPMPLLRELRY
eukprot:2735629-Rhodomonas_salina.5